MGQSDWATGQLGFSIRKPLEACTGALFCVENSGTFPVFGHVLGRNMCKHLCLMQRSIVNPSKLRSGIEKVNPIEGMLWRGEIVRPGRAGRRNCS